MSKTPGPTSNMGNRNSSQGNRRQPSNDSNYQIYVGDLDLTVSKQQLVDHFRKKYHSVVEGKIIMDQTTKMSKGYGFVQFSSYEESQRALTEMQGTLIKGKPVKVSQGVSRHGNSGHSGTGNSRSGNDRNMNSSMFGQAYGAQGILRSTQVLLWEGTYWEASEFNSRLLKAYSNLYMRCILSTLLSSRPANNHSWLLRLTPALLHMEEARISMQTR